MLLQLDRHLISHGEGEKGITKEVILELKLLADVGLVGFPNAGKSTILSRVTAATPKIADYPFTTIQPNLGVVKTEYGESFVLADIPGIIEGASEGIGLGIQFLRHVERTRLLLHVIDVSGLEGRKPVEDFHKINQELRKYSENLSKRKQIIVANKVDVMQDEEGLKELEKMAQQEKIELYKISAVTGQGVDELFERVAQVLKELPKEELIQETEERMVYTLEDEKDDYYIRKENDIYVVEGPAIERLLRKINMEDNESLYYFQKNIKAMGVEAKLKQMGIKEGDTIRFIIWEFEYYE